MRGYGQFTTTIWQDPDFTSLSQPLQQVYFMLGTQPNLTACGSLALTTGRWARMAGGIPRTMLEEQLVALEAHAARHIVIDHDTEELLIRKFMKWDKGWFNEKRAPVVADAIRAIASVHIRDIAVDELRRLIPTHALSARAQDALSVVLRDTASDTHADTTGLRVTEGDHSALDLNPIPEPGASGLVASDGPPSMFCEEHPNGTTEPCGACARAREVYVAAAQSRLEDELAAKRAAAKAIADCTWCDDKGLLEHPTTGLPAGRCDHTTPPAWISPAPVSGLLKTPESSQR